MNQIPLTTHPCSTQDIVLDGQKYRMVVKWNTRGEFWTISLWDMEDNALLSGVKMVVNYDLLEGARHLEVPKGALVVFDASGNADRIAYDDFSNDRALALYYVTEDEFAIIRA